MQKFSYLQVGNVEYIDALYQRYLADPHSVEDSWRYLFEGMELGHVTEKTPELDWESEVKVARLIEAYRSYGGWLADINPLQPPPSSHPELTLSRFELTEADLNRPFHAGKLISLGTTTLKSIIDSLRAIYCGSFSVEIGHISSKETRDWIREKLEGSKGREKLAPEARRKMLERVSQADRFEYFLHTRYVAKKRFSLEGGEALIPALDRIVELGAELGAEEFVIGMAHRGRLNVLTHTLGKKPETILVEFEGNYKTEKGDGDGDVKYHKGYLNTVTTSQGKKVRMTLAANPSHLEFVNPVVEGMARARQDQLQDLQGTRVVPLLIHGDAAFAGQGVCYETMNMSQLEGYLTGGTIHIVINNQIGFTTDPKDARSTKYSTDMAKMLEVPIFHVNGDDVDAMAFVAKLAIEFRQKFRQDVVIDQVCYRRHGHNEGDEPAFTQPLLYQKIKNHATVRETYAKRLLSEGIITEAEITTINESIISSLEEAQKIARAGGLKPKNSDLEESWKGLKQGTLDDYFLPTNTAVDENTLREISIQINRMPDGFRLHPKLVRFFEAREKSITEGTGIDWGTGEALAYASLMREGHSVRLSGQDVERGTFTHRQSVLHDVETGEKYYPFNSVATQGARYEVHNSLLSETGVMGFEYGYSLVAPATLTLWEAQFGDFANGAQVIIDQFLASGETKWQRMSGLVLLLPHGYEGQGPEHSSARLERFLQLAADGNMAVSNLTTPAQIFHALRRQVKWTFRKPLVIMSPKSLLRHPLAVSRLEEFTQGAFQEVINDQKRTSQGKAVRRVLLCTGKVYYDLLAEQQKQESPEVALVRLEQLHPWPTQALARVLEGYPNAREVFWVQEEPRNMGAWTYVFSMWHGGLDEFADRVGGRSVKYIGREAAASPAVGSEKWHAEQQAALVAAAFRRSSSS